MSNPAASLSPAQIRRRANDYDSQIRQGLEDGNVRQVVKRLGNDLVSKKKNSHMFIILIFCPI